MAKSLGLLTLGFSILLIYLDFSAGCSCLPKHEPICGEDGITYKNPCILFCSNWNRIQQLLLPVKEKCKGLCECCDPKPCNCDLIDQNPVCGKDGLTYKNLCILECKNKLLRCKELPDVEVKCRNRCENCLVKNICSCSSVYDPKCGYDGKTYFNQCQLDCINKERRKNYLLPIKIKCEKACSQCLAENCSCGFEHKPVCGSDLKSYNNSCQLKCENKKREKINLPQIRIFSDTECEKCTNCNNLICSSIYQPVCASDGYVYENECQYNNENKYRKLNKLPLLTLQCKKSCEECADETCRCPQIKLPVCGSNNVTYNSKCFLECENRKRFNQNLSRIDAISNRACKNYAEEQKRCDCDLKFAAVCGSDNNTYSNFCQFDCENFQREEINLNPLNLICKRPCNECINETCLCDKVFSPVCGSDKKTYSNLCSLNCENKKRYNQNITRLGVICDCRCEECKEVQCLCPQNVEPVCGLDGKTYLNECSLNCTNKERKRKNLPLIGIKCNQACKNCSKPETCVCPADDESVCGSNNRTYAGKCILSCLNRYRAKKGLPAINVKCEDRCERCFTKNTCNCPEIYNPVCGSNGVTFENDCMLSCENKERALKNHSPIHLCSKRKCIDSPQCKPCNCSSKFKPVCGSDGFIYDNECSFDCENEYRKSHNLTLLNIRCKKTCKECINDTCLTSKEFSPVCGTDGETYDNESILNCKNKKRYNMKLAPVKIRCKRTCQKCDEEDKRCRCKNIIEPICGSDNVTYNNFCQLDCENFYRQEKNATSVKINCNKACDDCNEDPCQCSAKYNPVCGSDGKTYSNICSLECAKKERLQQSLEQLEVFCEGECDSCYEEVYRCSCDDTYQPVCGSDGNTYDNFCQFDCGNYLLEQEGEKPIELARRDKC